MGFGMKRTRGGGPDDPDGKLDDPGFRDPDGPGCGRDEAKRRAASLAARVRTSGWGPDDPASGCIFGCSWVSTYPDRPGWGPDRSRPRPDRPASLGLGIFPLRLHACLPLPVLLAS